MGGIVPPLLVLLGLPHRRCPRGLSSLSGLFLGLDDALLRRH